ncbi:MAG: methyltransferase family protein [Terriglobales bacterium]
MAYIPFPYSGPALRACFWVSFGLWTAMETWVWLRERGGTAGANRDRGSRAWVVAAVWISLYGAFALMFQAPSGAIGFHPMAWFIAGIALELAGVALRFSAVRTLGQFFRTSVIIQDTHRIISHGPYRHLRNPSYTGATLTMAGLGLAMSNWYSLAVLVGGILAAYARRISVEQQALEAHFGQPYRDYMASTWALIPYVW